MRTCDGKRCVGSVEGKQGAGSGGEVRWRERTLWALLMRFSYASTDPSCPARVGKVESEGEREGWMQASLQWEALSGLRLRLRLARVCCAHP